MTFPDNTLITLSSLQMALDQPALSGKLILWSLLMLSLVCWVMILSKAVTLKKMKRADVLFTRRLRRSRTTLEVFEEGWEDPNSLHHEIYLHGAKEAAFQMLGTREPNATMHNRIKKADKLTRDQIESLREAFVRGQETAADRLFVILPTLKAIAVSTPLLGAVGMSLMLMRGFSISQAYEQVAPWVSGSMVFMVLALSVALPAAIAGIIFKTTARHRVRELNNFRVEVARLFERSFAEPMVSKEDHQKEDEPAAEIREEEDFQKAPAANHLEYQYKPKTKPKAASGEKREFRSLRKTQEASTHLVEDSDEDEINPIAKQAASLRTAF